MAGGIRHPTALVESDQVGEGTNVWAYAHVMKGAAVGRHCNIGDHAFIESGAFVGAGAVITRPVPDHAVVVGNPARVRGFVCECCQPLSGSGTSLVCEKCGPRYVKSRQGVSRATVPLKPKAKAAR